MNIDMNSVPEPDACGVSHFLKPDVTIPRSYESLGIKKPDFPFLKVQDTAPPADSDDPEAKLPIYPMAELYIPYRLMREANEKFGVPISKDAYVSNVMGLRKTFLATGIPVGKCQSGAFQYHVDNNGERVGTITASTIVCHVQSTEGVDAFVIGDRTKNFGLSFKAGGSTAPNGNAAPTDETGGRGMPLPKPRAKGLIWA